MAYSFKGSINLGFIYIPITLHLVVKDQSIHFHMLDRKTQSRVKYKKTCVDCKNRELKNEDIIKGFEYEEGKYVLFEEEDFEKIKEKKDKNIIIEHFANLNEIDPIYYDKSYYINPIGGKKAFLLLLKAIEKEKKVGIAKTVIGNKESLVLIRVKDGQMILNTMHFQEELQESPIININDSISTIEFKLAKELIDSMTKPFDPLEYKDEYKLKLEKAIELKIKGKNIVSSKEQKQIPVKDLMEALQMSLKKNKKNNSRKQV